MTYPADDLSPLLLAPPAGPSQAMRYRQGVVKTWNPVTLENTVAVGGAELTNLPVLGVAEAASFAPGVVVGIARLDETWAIIGRFVRPGTADATDAITRIGQRRLSAEVLTNETTNSATFVDLATVGPLISMLIPASGKVQVTISSYLGGPSNQCSVDISGAFTEAPSLAKGLVIATAGMVASRVVVYTGLPPGGLCTFKLMYASNGVSTVDFRNRTIIVEAL